MQKLTLSNLMIEVTRKCNMKCEHCLRGEMQNKNIPHEYITTLLENVNCISNVVFTGGEPSLNVKAIQFFIDECKRLKINVGCFYIATNAKKIKDNFMNVLLDLYLLCDDKEECCVHISNSYFHEYEMLGNDDVEPIEYRDNKEKLQAFKFVSFKSENGKMEDLKNYINQGKFIDNYGNDGRDLKVYKIEINDGFIDGEIYLNCNGDLISGCDYSYESQAENDVIICSVKEKDYIKAIEKYNDKIKVTV